jgi:hypothetical protein
MNSRKNEKAGCTSLLDTGCFFILMLGGMPDNRRHVLRKQQ